MEKTLKEILKTLKSIDGRLRKIEGYLGKYTPGIMVDEKTMARMPEISE